MKKSLILLSLLSASLINAEPSVFRRVLDQSCSFVKSKSKELSRAFDATSRVNKALIVATPINLLVGALGYEAVQCGEAHKVKAAGIYNNPQANIDFIRDYCADYRETQRVTAYSDNRVVSVDVSTSNLSLYSMFTNNKSDPEKLKDLAYLIQRRMNQAADDVIFAGKAIPSFVLVLSIIISGMAIAAD
jgi:hypothetical protein